MPKIETLVENWTTSKPAQWTPWDDDTNKYVTGGTLRLGYTPDYVGLGTIAETWDVTSSSYVVKVVTMPSASGQQLGVYIAPTGQSRGLGFTIENGNVFCWIDGNGSDVQVPNSGNGITWLRLRESGGTFYHDTSPDGVTWTNRRATSTNLPSPLTSCGVSFFAGGSGGGYAAIGPLNANAGRSASGSFSGTGTFAAVVSRKAVTAPATIVGVGSLAAAPTLRADTVALPTRSASGTLAATASQTQLRSASLTVAGTLAATPRPAYRQALPATTAEATLRADTRARIIAEAEVDLDTVWLNVAQNLADGRSFVTLQGLQVTTEREGEVRRYTTGRLRQVLKAGRRRSATLTLNALSRDEVGWLESNVGEVLCFRDDRGRKFYGVFTSVPVTEHSYNAEADVQLALAEVTHSEVV